MGIELLNIEIAQEVAEKLTGIIGHRVMLTDDSGVIIGCSNTERIGTFHEPSVEVVQKRITTPEDSTAAWRSTARPEGVEPGVTLAVVLEDDVVGTVAIAGDPSEVDRFGMVVKSQTESMLRETMILRSVLLKERALQTLLYDIVSYDPTILDPAVLEMRGAQLGYDLTLRRVAIVVDLDRERADANASSSRPTSLDKNDRTLARTQADVSRTIREVFDGGQDLATSLGTDKFVILHWMRSHEGAASDLRVRSLCQQLTGQLEARHGVAARIGVGAPTGSVSELRWSYYDAWNALSLGRRLAIRPRELYVDEFRLEELLLTISLKSCERFLTVMLDGLRGQKDWPELRSTVLAWCESGYSLASASEALRIHRNTLRYRLGKLEKLGGRSPHDRKYAIRLYVACLLDRLGLQSSE